MAAVVLNVRRDSTGLENVEDFFSQVDEQVLSQGVNQVRLSSISGVGTNDDTFDYNTSSEIDEEEEEEEEEEQQQEEEVAEEEEEEEDAAPSSSSAKGKGKKGMCCMYTTHTYTYTHLHTHTYINNKTRLFRDAIAPKRQRRRSCQANASSSTILEWGRRQRWWC